MADSTHAHTPAGEGARTGQNVTPAHRPLVPLMLFVSSMIMALAWLGHLKFKQLPYSVAIPVAWLMVLPEYALNIAALRRGYGRYTGGQMAAFRLCSGVVCVALVARVVLDEALTTSKLVGFGLMLVAMVLIAAKPDAKPPPAAGGHLDEDAA